MLFLIKRTILNTLKTYKYNFNHSKTDFYYHYYNCHYLTFHILCINDMVCIDLSISLYIYIYSSLYIHTYIYIYREREREIFTY